MTIGYNKFQVQIRLDALRANYRLLSKRASGCMPVIKSDAYGHGLVPVADMLVQEGATLLAAGTAGECAQLRSAGHTARLLALLGAPDPAETPLCIAQQIIPAVYDMATLHRLHAATAQGTTTDIALKFDTGMARLGFSAADVPALREALRALPRLHPVLVLSHLAVADDPTQADFTRQQGETFATILASLRDAFPGLRGSLANSAGILAHPELHHDVQRPGIAMYGSNPLRNTPLAHLGHGLIPAMDVSVPVLQTHPLPAGRSISYGRTFVAKHDMQVAIVASGYADAFSRGLSGKGCMVVNGRRAPILGRVCMQMCALDVTDIPDVTVGHRAWVMGGPDACAITPDELADQWGTISYEVLCLLGMNPRTVA